MFKVEIKLLDLYLYFFAYFSFFLAALCAYYFFNLDFFHLISSPFSFIFDSICHHCIQYFFLLKTLPKTTSPVSSSTSASSSPAQQNNLHLLLDSIQVLKQQSKVSPWFGWLASLAIASLEWAPPESLLKLPPLDFHLDVHQF